MASSSMSYNISNNSKSENEIQSDVTFNSTDIDINNTSSPIKTSLTSNFLHRSSNNSIRHFKKLKRKNHFHNSEFQPQNKYSTSSYSMRSIKNKHFLPESKNVSNYQTKKHKFKKSNSANSYYNNLSQESIHTIESSFNSDFSDLKYFKIISKNQEISMSSPISQEKRQLISYKSLTRKKRPTINNLITNNKHFESSTSSNSFDISQTNFDSNDLKTKTNNELNLDELLSDCSLSDSLYLRKDDGDRNSPSSSSAIIDTSHFKKLTPPMSLLESNVSFGISDDTPPQEPSIVIIETPGLSNNRNKDELSQVEIDEQNCTENNEHFEVNQNNHSELIPKQKSNLYSLDGNYSSELRHNLRKDTRSLKNTKNSSHTVSETDKNQKEQLKELQHSKLNKDKTPSILSTKKSLGTKKTKKSRSTHMITEDIGLNYNTDEDNYMVELPNGAIVPSFLSTLKPKYVKKVCVCGITKEEIPEHWSESFHDVLHLNFYKLRFIGSLPQKDVINIKHNNLSYRIVMLCVNNYNEENIKKTIKNVDDFVCLEYGIPKINIHQFKYSTYLAVLPNLKVIGYLEVEPIQSAYTLTHDGQFSENIIPAKFGVFKIWVLIKHRNTNVDINLLEIFRKKEKLQKKDMAFSLSGCQSVQFIKQYIGNKNILVYN